jgi:hypothetical protein
MIHHFLAAFFCTPAGFVLALMVLRAPSALASSAVATMSTPVLEPLSCQTAVDDVVLLQTSLDLQLPDAGDTRPIKQSTVSDRVDAFGTKAISTQALHLPAAPRASGVTTQRDGHQRSLFDWYPRSMALMPWGHTQFAPPQPVRQPIVGQYREIPQSASNIIWAPPRPDFVYQPPSMQQIGGVPQTFGGVGNMMSTGATPLVALDVTSAAELVGHVKLGFLELALVDLVAACSFLLALATIFVPNVVLLPFVLIEDAEGEVEAIDGAKSPHTQKMRSKIQKHGSSHTLLRIFIFLFFSTLCGICVMWKIGVLQPLVAQVSATAWLIIIAVILSGVIIWEAWKTIKSIVLGICDEFERLEELVMNAGSQAMTDMEQNVGCFSAGSSKK